MIKAIIFDVDDTLYDLSGPFREAFHELYPLEELDLEGAFLASRRYSDSVYAKSLSGEMSMEDMYVYRFQNAFHDYGKNMDAQEALHFQEIYEKHQHMIHMTEAMQEFLKELSDKMVLGIITNGPSGHQWDKIRALEATRWIPKDHVFISGEHGVAKPERRIFELVQEKLMLQPKEFCYVGDSYENDIEGAKGAGWTAIWYNHRNPRPTGSAEPDYMVRSEKELLELLSQVASGK